MAEEHRGRIDEEPPAAYPARQPAEDRLQAEGLQLDVHVVLPGDREKDVGRLEWRSLGPADERLPADDGAVGQVADRLVGGAELPASHDPLQGRAEVDPLAGLPLAHDLHGLGHLARMRCRDDLHARIVERTRLDAWTVIRSTAFRRTSAAAVARRSPRRRAASSSSETSAAASRRSGQRVENVEPVGAGEADREEIAASGSASTSSRSPRQRPRGPGRSSSQP